LGTFISPLRLPVLFYRAFVRDFARVHRALPFPLRLRFWLLQGLQLLSALSETFTLVVISLFALAVATPEALADSRVMQKILEFLPFLKDRLANPRETVQIVSFLMIAVVMVKCVLALVANRASTVWVELCNKAVTMEVVRLFVYKDYAWHMTAESHDALVRILDRHQFAIFMTHTMGLYSNALLCLVLFVSLFILEPGLTLVVVLVFGFAGTLLYGAVRLRLDRAGKAAYEAELEGRKVLISLQKAMREIVIHRRQALSVDHFGKVFGRSLRPRAFVNFAAHIPTQILEFVGFLTIGTLMIVMLRSSLPMDRIVATASLLMLTAWRILPALNRCLSASVLIRGLRPMAMNFLDLLESFRKEPGPQAPAPSPGFGFKGSLGLEDASFRYPGAEALALRDMGLKVAKGEFLGVIGPSGSGKSTLALLLTGLVPPSSGLFLVDGERLGPGTREAYFDDLGYVPQSPLVIDGTIAENISFEGPGAPRDDKRLERAATLAALDLEKELPDGLDTNLSSASQTLSGGQIQRIAIARALYREPGILILDEATSALDLLSEKLLRKSLAALKGSTTTIIIAHRLSSVEDCDRVLWLDGGKAVRIGPPEEILPLYRAEAEALAEAKAQKMPGPEAGPEAGPLAELEAGPEADPKPQDK
jgi:ABC-type multidrug transport system fused ATPase/permease subunit